MTNRKEQTKRKQNVLTAILSACIVVSVAIQLFSYVLSWFDDSLRQWMFVNTYILWFLIILHIASGGIHKHFLLFGFYVCFFTFLMGQKLFVVLGGGAIDEFLTFTFLKLSAKEYVTFINLLYMALLGTYCGYRFFRTKRFNGYSTKIQEKRAQKKLAKMRKLLRVLYVVTFICALCMQAQIVLAKSGMSYTDGYLINVDVHPVLKIGNYLYTGIAFLLLACKPKKKEMLAVLCSFMLVEGVLQLFIGRRALIARLLLFICWYLICYFKFYKKKLRWKHYLFLLCGGVAVIVLFYFVEAVRSGSQVGKFSLLEIFEKFFVSTGGSDSTIANIIRYKDRFPKSGIVYLCDPLRDAFLHNPAIRLIIALLGGTNVPSFPQGAAFLQCNDSFSHWLSYIVNPELYLSGYGMGSSFIAETYFAFGAIGVLVFSILLGMFIQKIGHIEHEDDRAYGKAIKMFFAYNLFMLPRGSVFSWASEFLYFLAALLLVKIAYGVLWGSATRYGQGVKRERIS